MSTTHTSAESLESVKDDDTISVGITSVEQDILCEALDIALVVHQIDGVQSDELSAVRKVLNNDEESYDLTDSQWDLVIRCLSYADVRDECGEMRIDYMQHKLIRRVDGIRC